MWPFVDDLPMVRTFEGLSMEEVMPSQALNVALMGVGVVVKSHLAMQFAAEEVVGMSPEFDVELMLVVETMDAVGMLLVGS